MACKYNITTIKDKRSLLVKTSKGFPKRAAQQQKTYYKKIIIITTKEKVTPIINQ